MRNCAALTLGWSPGRCRVLAVLCVFAGVVCGCAQKDERAPVVYETHPWKFGPIDGTRIETEHYAIFTTINDEVLLDTLPGFVEAANERYRQLVPPGKEPDERMRLYLFASRPQWEVFTKRYAGPRAETLLKIRNGGYVEGGIAAMQYVANSITFPLFAHEGLHQYLHYYAQPGIPAWINEGLAVYCEGLRWVKDGEFTFDPWYNPTRLNGLGEALQRNELYGLRKLLSTNPGEVIYETSRAVSNYYAQVWALTLFLIHGEDGKYAESYRRLLDQLSTVDLRQHARAAQIWSDRDSISLGEAIFRNYISEDLDTVEREFRHFMRTEFLKPS